MRIFDLPTSKARYELKVVPLHLWRVNVKTIRGFIHIPLQPYQHASEDRSGGEGGGQAGHGVRGRVEAVC